MSSTDSPTGILPAPTNTDLVIIGIVLFLFSALAVNVIMIVSVFSFLAGIVVMAYGFGFDFRAFLDQIPIPSIEPEAAEVEKQVVDDHWKSTPLELSPALQRNMEGLQTFKYTEPVELEPLTPSMQLTVEEIYASQNIDEESEGRDPTIFI